MTAELDADQGTPVSSERVPGSHVDVAPLATSPSSALPLRLAGYVAQVGLLAAAANLGVSRQTLDRALGGRRVIRAIEKMMLDGLDRDDRARATTNEGNAASRRGDGNV